MDDNFNPDYPFATIIDVNGIRVEFVQVEQDWQGNLIPQYYEMQAGESLVLGDWQTANDLATRWTQVRLDGEKWIGEGEEIPQPEPPEPTPTAEEMLEALLRGYRDESDE